MPSKPLIILYEKHPLPTRVLNAGDRGRRATPTGNKSQL
jgi:hypothetical protein